MLVNGVGVGCTNAGDDLSCTHKSKTITAKVIAAKSCKREAVHGMYLRDLGIESDCGNYNTIQNDAQAVLKKVQKLTVGQALGEIDSLLREKRDFPKEAPYNLSA